MRQQYVFGALVVAAMAAGYWLRGIEPSPIADRAPTSPSPFTSTDVAPPAPRVTIEELGLPRIGVTTGDRNPFRFHDPVAAAVRYVPTRAEVTPALHVPAAMPAQAEPALPIRYTGSLVARHALWAIFSDCRGYTTAARLGDWVLGEFRVLNIAEQSVLLQRSGGKPSRLAMAGCAPR